MIMSTSYLVTSLLLVVLIVPSDAHKPGDEFAYLSMFLKPNKKQSQVDMESMYHTYSLSPSGTSSRFSRRLHHVSNPPKSPASEDPTSTSTQIPDLFPDSDSPDQAAPDQAAPDQAAPGSPQDPSVKPTKPDPDSDTNPPSTPAREIEKGADAPLQLASRQGEDIVRLTQMVVKIIRQYRIKSLVDVPCRAHAHWMPGVLKHLSTGKNPIPSFRYSCVDTNHRMLSALRNRLIDQGLNRGTRFVLRRFWKESLPKGDLVLSWAGLDNMSKKNVRAFFERISKSNGRHKLMLVGSHSGELARDGNLAKIARFTNHGHPINVRKDPFLLSKPLRIIKEVAAEGNDKQIYIYFPESMLTEVSDDR